MARPKHNPDVVITAEEINRWRAFAKSSDGYGGSFAVALAIAAHTTVLEQILEKLDDIEAALGND